MISIARPATIRRGLALASATVLLLAGPAHGGQRKGAFHEEEDRVLDCGGGLVLDVHDVNDGTFIGVQHGDGLWYFSEHWDHVVRPTPTLPPVSPSPPGTPGWRRRTTRSPTTETAPSPSETLSPAPVRYLRPGRSQGLALLGPGRLPLPDRQRRGAQDPNDDEFLDFLGVESAHGHVDDLGVCDLAPEYLT